MEQYERRLSRSQTLESLLYVNYLGTQLMKDHLQQATQKKLYPIGVSIEILRWKICETSARGVAFKAANIGTEKNGPSREEMARVVKTQTNYSPAGTRARAVEDVLRASFAEDKPAVWSVGEAIEAIPVDPKAQECKHGPMILKEGVAKTGRDFYGYVCSAAKPDQCDAKWAKKTAAGSWFFPSNVEGGE